MTFTNKAGVSFVLLFVMVQATANARFNIQSFGWNHMARDFIVENEVFHGKLNERDSWRGTLCNGYYAYNVDVQGVAKGLDFEVVADDAIDAYADLRDIAFAVDGSYRSDYTACVPMAGGIGVTTGRAQIRARITLGQDESMKDLRVRITSTQFDTIHLGRYAPAWFEKFVTGLVNRALRLVWSSRLGEWLSDRLSEELRRRIGARG